MVWAKRNNSGVASATVRAELALVKQIGWLDSASKPKKVWATLTALRRGSSRKRTIWRLLELLMR